MITAVSWIPKGNLKAVPDVAEPPSKEELKELIESGAFARSVDGSNEDEEEIAEDGEEISEVDRAKAVAEAFGKSSKSKIASSSMEVDEVAEGLKELDMDNYDEEDDGIELFSSGIGDLYYPSNEMDPYLKDVEDEDDEEDIDDTTIKPTDSVIICARNEDEVSHLEVYVYEESSGSPNMYVHHHIIIPEFPLCTAWIDCPLKGGEKGNFVAIGSKESPTIEIWDLDVRDEVLPCIQLGGKEEMLVTKKKKSKKVKSKKEKSKKQKYKEGSHTDSVLGLAWNKEFRNILASASADKKVKVWDVATGVCKITMEHHTKEVQAVAWNHYAPEVLLSGSFDQTVVLKDGRQPSHSGFKWSVMSDVESLAWDPHSEHSFVVSLEDGTVKGFDIRTAQSGSDSDLKPSFTIQAHDQDKGVSSISYNISAPNLLATGSMDKTVKLWDLTNNEPSCLALHKPKAGAVFSISFAVDNPFLLAIGGSKGELHVWDTLLDADVCRKYGSKRS
ncbi:PREDICTED: periodic tryptophan protein 1 homolog [Camelina sativa]|uniref:Periodic tryptophan protein 1 homolog n=1 Tax=Camelina sativa TaxID=90675 RepID=A0ABM0V1K4_CAMSA|nr:PREDICTED: periodic tryptophan protein 1 homolog [Camelina sativa]